MPSILGRPGTNRAQARGPRGPVPFSKIALSILMRRTTGLLCAALGASLYSSERGKPLPSPAERARICRLLRGDFCALTAGLRSLYARFAHKKRSRIAPAPRCFFVMGWVIAAAVRPESGPMSVPYWNGKRRVRGAARGQRASRLQVLLLQPQVWPWPAGPVPTG